MTYGHTPFDSFGHFINNMQRITCATSPGDVVSTTTAQAWVQRHSHHVNDTVAHYGYDMTVTETYVVGTHAIFVGEIDVVDGNFLDHIVDDLNDNNGTAGCSLEVSNGKMYIAVPLPTRVIAPVKATDVLGLQAHT